MLEWFSFFSQFFNLYMITLSPLSQFFNLYMITLSPLSQFFSHLSLYKHHPLYSPTLYTQSLDHPQFLYI